jgi:serine/threonine-protein kinase RsbW
MTADEVCALAAGMDCLPQAIAFVEEFCRHHQVASGDGLRLSLVVEELFTNTVMHGHGGDSDAPVRIGLAADLLHLDLSYEDTAPPFDPLDHVARSKRDPGTEVFERPVGQFGLALVVSMAVRAGYEREDGWNRLRLTLRRQAPDDADT